MLELLTFVFFMMLAGATAGALFGLIPLIWGLLKKRKHEAVHAYGVLVICSMLFGPLGILISPIYGVYLVTIKKSQTQLPRKATIVDDRQINN